MSITKLEQDMAIIQKLDDEPNDVGGLTAAELKAKFDEAGETIKTYINEKLIPSTTAENIPFAETPEIPADTVQGAVEAVQKQLGEAVMGQVPDGSITPEKLAPETLEPYSTKEELESAVAGVETALEETSKTLEKDIEENRAESWKVGDVRHSARTDLGEKWLLCNGEVVDSAEYPELDEILLHTVGSTLKVKDTGGGDSSNGTLYGAASDGETLVAAGGVNGSGTPLVYAANHPDHTWTRVEPGGMGYVRRVVYAEGKWILCGGRTYTKLSTHDYRTDLVLWHTGDPYGTWEKIVVATLPNASNRYDDYISGLAYGDGIWIATVSTGSSNTTGDGVWVYMAEALDGPWRRVEVDTSYTSNNMLKGVAYHEGRWVVTGSTNRTYYSDNPEKGWVLANTAGTSVTVGGVDVAWGGGRWLIASGSNVYYTEDPANGWTTVDTGGNAAGLRYDEENGLWVTAGTSCIMYSANGASWTTVSASGTWYGLAHCRGVWAAVGGGGTIAVCTFETPGDSPTGRAFDGGSSNSSIYQVTYGGAVACHDGVWVGALSFNQKLYGAPFRVALSPRGPWGLNFAGLSPGSGSVYLYDVRYADGLWVAVGATNPSSGSGYPVVCTAEDPFGAWTIRQVSTAVKSGLLAVSWYDGMWVASGRQGYVWCATDPTGSWTPYQITGTASNTYDLVDIDVWEGQWATVSATGLWMTTDPETTGWTVGTPPNTSNITHLVCADGLWAAGLKTGINILTVPTSGNSYVTIRTTQDITAGWSGATFTADAGTLKGLAKCEDGWLLAVDNNSVCKLYRTGDPMTEDWTLESEVEGTYKVSGLAAEGREAATIGYETATYTIQTGGLARTLPAISPDGCYAYIRGKE